MKRYGIMYYDENRTVYTIANTYDDKDEASSEMQAYGWSSHVYLLDLKQAVITEKVTSYKQMG